MEKDYIYIGKIVNTHGIKGELRILSNFPYKEKVFVVGKKILMDNKEYTIMSYRHHKNYEMVTLDQYHDINEVLFLLKKEVYVDKNTLTFDDNEILDEELITYKVLTNKGKEGIIKEIFYASPTNKILRVFLDKEVLVPYSFIKKIDKVKKEVVIELIEGME